MTVPMSVLKLTVGVPAVVASCLLWVVALALLPPTVAVLAFLAGVTVLVLPRRGRRGADGGAAAVCCPKPDAK